MPLCLTPLPRLQSRDVRWIFLQAALYVSLLPQKRTLLTALHVAEGVCAPVAHRQVVLTIPKRLRLHARFDRNLTLIAPNIDAGREFQAAMAALELPSP